MADQRLRPCIGLCEVERAEFEDTEPATELADAGLAMLSASGPLQGAIRGSVGLEQRPDGPGLRWFVRLAVEPVSAPVRIVDPLLGVQALMLPLLPAQPLVDWSLA